METHALWKQYYAYMHQTFDSFRGANVKTNCTVSSTQNVDWPRPKSLDMSLISQDNLYLER